MASKFVISHILPNYLMIETTALIIKHQYKCHYSLKCSLSLSNTCRPSLWVDYRRQRLDPCIYFCVHFLKKKLVMIYRTNIILVYCVHKYNAWSAATVQCSSSAQKHLHKPMSFALIHPYSLLYSIPFLLHHRSLRPFCCCQYCHLR